MKSHHGTVLPIRVFFLLDTWHGCNHCCFSYRYFGEEKWMKSYGFFALTSLAKMHKVWLTSVLFRDVNAFTRLMIKSCTLRPWILYWWCNSAGYCGSYSMCTLFSQIQQRRWLFKCCHKVVRLKKAITSLWSAQEMATLLHRSSCFTFQ